MGAYSYLQYFLSFLLHAKLLHGEEVEEEGPVAAEAVSIIAVHPAQSVNHPGAAGHKAEPNSNAAPEMYKSPEKATTRPGDAKMVLCGRIQVIGGITVRILKRTGMMTVKILEKTGMMTEGIAEKTGGMTGAGGDVGAHLHIPHFGDCPAGLELFGYIHILIIDADTPGTAVFTMWER
jgi:hypothetical protein